jgi:phosphoenolpyruvate-protein phosphotransferase (PTS system enzyme I)
VQQTLTGIPASPGIVVGPVHLLRWEVPEVPLRVVPEDAMDAEMEKFRDAVERARERLRSVRERAEKKAGPEEAAIFDVQLSMLDDQELINAVEALIRKNHAAERAFDIVMFEWRQHFSRHPQAMVRERVGDLVDIHIRMLSLLLGLPDHDPVDVPKGSNAILVTHDLTPSLTIQLDREAIAGIATDAGTRTAHVAILARSLGLPAVVGLRDATTRLQGGEHAILDGTSGVLVVEPSDAEKVSYQQQAAREAEEEANLLEHANEEAITLDGVKIVLRANVDLPEDAPGAAQWGAEGVGLMRTEFLVVGRATMPDEEEQYQEYSNVVKAFPGRPVVIRTFDVGGDKLPVGGYASEANPFLGWRAIRMCLDQPEVFKPQLRALLRAAVHGDVRIMLPLVVTVDEVRAARALLLECAAELASRGIPHRSDVPLGAMIETPAAAVAADTLAGEAAFFSIGTNDLVQYTLAVDRGNVELADRFTPLHPAVLRLIKRTEEVGRGAGLEVAVCGEMASQPLTALALVGLGIRHFSVSARAIPWMKRLVRAVRADDAQDASEKALSSATADDAERHIRALLESAFPA